MGDWNLQQNCDFGFYFIQGRQRHAASEPGNTNRGIDDLDLIGENETLECVFRR